MDDFYTEMQYIVEELLGKESYTQSNIQPQDSGILASYFSNMFAQALVPINPRHWAAYTAGSAASSDMPDLTSKLTTPFNNLVAAS